jgi:thioredoxin reductase (NADPH)
MTHDLLVVGAGPAGVSAALWARSLDLSAVVLECEARAGGQLQSIFFEPREVPALAPGDGPALAARYMAQLATAGIEVRLGLGAREILPAAEGVTVRDASGASHAARALLIATGLMRRRLGVPGEVELEGRGVSTSSTRDRAQLAGRHVAVVGGGDAAFENALLLAEVGCRVLLLVRGRPRARAEFRERVRAAPGIEVLEDTRVAAILGESHVRAVRLEGSRGALERAVAGVVIKIGSLPNTEWCRAAVVCDGDGYVLADPRGRTSLGRVWAAGDVTRPALPSLSVAYGTAALAVADVRAALERA